MDPGSRRGFCIIGLWQDKPLAMVYRRTQEGWLFELLEQGTIEVPCLGVAIGLEDIYKGIRH
jgi:hypothetical protein